LEKETPKKGSAEQSSKTSRKGKRVTAGESNEKKSINSR
jgi:hypothetical protein